MTLKAHFLHILAGTDADWLGELQAQLDSEVVLTSGPELAVPADFDVLIAGRPSREQLLASSKLRALIIPFAGLPESTRALLADFPHISVHNLHHNTIQTAEMAVALLLAAARRIIPADRQMRLGDWTIRYEPPPVLILEGKTALIVGYGAIGRHVARVCQALGMRVLAVRRNSSPQTSDPLATEVHPIEDLPQLLPQAHVLMITLPLTDQTRGLIGAEQLALLPQDAVLVNVGRGAVVDEEALYQALHDGRLMAAGLDVWYQYPEEGTERTATLPSRFPFHQLDNVVLSPHRGGAYGSQYTEQARMAHLARLLNAAARGEPIPNQVDLQSGY